MFAFNGAVMFLLLAASFLWVPVLSKGYADYLPKGRVVKADDPLDTRSFKPDDCRIRAGGASLNVEDLLNKGTLSERAYIDVSKAMDKEMGVTKKLPEFTDSTAEELLDIVVSNIAQHVQLNAAKSLQRASKADKGDWERFVQQWSLNGILRKTQFRFTREGTSSWSLTYVTPSLNDWLSTQASSRSDSSSDSGVKSPRATSLWKKAFRPFRSSRRKSPQGSSVDSDSGIESPGSDYSDDLFSDGVASPRLSSPRRKSFWSRGSK